MDRIAYHSRNAVVAYHDLRRVLLEEDASAFRGTVEVRERNGRHYLYERYRIGTDMKARYVGEATPELMERVARAEALREATKARAEHRARLVRVLRAEGLTPVDGETGSLLLAFERIGLFRLGGTLVGTGAFALYEGELGVRFPREDLAQTGDLDIASFRKLSVALGDRVTEPVHKALAELSFEPAPAGLEPRIWRWRQTTRQTLVEFLTPAFEDEGVHELPALGVSAQALRYLDYLIAEPIKAVALYRSGVLVQVPRPERYAIHKLIVADRRKGGPDALKAGKDRAQAAFLVEVLAQERPDDLRDAWEDARSRGPKWRERIDRTLSRMPETAARLAGL